MVLCATTTGCLCNVGIYYVIRVIENQARKLGNYRSYYLITYALNMVFHKKQQEDSLFDTLNKNCSTAQDHALQLLMSCEIPVITAFSSLSKGDCMHALRKHTNKFNKLEQAVFLSTMTDYVTCASQNDELFDVFNKGNKHYNLSTVLMELGSKWEKFFVQLKASDLTQVQLRSLVSLLQRSMNRLTDYKWCLREALIASEIKLNRNEFHSDFLSSTSVSLYHQLETAEGQQQRNRKCLAAYSDTGVSQRPAVATCVIKSQNHLTVGNITLHTVKNIPKVENENMTLSPKLPPKRKYGADITKYILKASENRVMDDKVKDTEIEIIDLQVKKTEIEILDTDADILGSQKSLIPSTTVHQSNFIGISLDSPAMKKQKLEKLPTGKVNAFTLLMKNSKSLKKNNTIKS